MSAATWEDQNAAFLSHALAWLRARLEALASGHPHPKLAEPVWTRTDTGDEAIGAPPALLLLGERFALSAFERQLLLLCAAVELDPAVGPLCGRAQPASKLAQPTFALAFALFDAPAWDALSPQRPLRDWQLIDADAAGRPLTGAPLRADERIVNFIKGLDHPDERVTALLAPPGPAAAWQGALPPSQAAMVDRLVAAWQSPEPGPVLLVGPDPDSKLLVAARAAARAGVQLSRLPAELLPQHPADVDAFERLWRREAMLSPVALYVDAEEQDLSDGPASAMLRRLLARLDGVAAVATREAWPAARAMQTLAIAKPTRAEQAALWQTALGAKAPLATRLASHFSLPAPRIAELAGQGAADAELWQACRSAVRPRLDKLAQRVDARAGWDDLVLPAEQSALLRQIADQVAQRGTIYDDWGFAAHTSRGLGISALFSGASGTGKTLAAEVIANSLQLDLYRIDLSGVVSKYIGETEKNLRRLFDAAEDGGTILFFDEADALFGKRSEVKDSHDRYANIEINYLLQRIETYQGLAILATNLRSALDDAFLRRLRFVVSFPYPGRAERREIWRRAFPPQAHVGALDLDRLARLNLTGGNIANVSLNAAFRAAAGGGRIEMAHVLEAARAEYVKLDRPMSEADFRLPLSMESAA